MEDNLYGKSIIKKSKKLGRKKKKRVEWSRCVSVWGLREGKTGYGLGGGCVDWG